MRSRQITLNARPTGFAFDPSRTAVVVVDMQNDFGAEGGMFARAGIDISGIKAAVPPTARVLAAARRARLPIVYLKMGYAPDLAEAGGAEAPNWIKHQSLQLGAAVTAPDGSASRILVRDTWNTDIVPELTPQVEDLVVWKTRFSGFYRTELDEVLKAREVDSLIFTGCTTSVCVESTIRDAMFRDYRCLLLEDCTAEPIGAGLPRSNHDASLLTIEILFGWVTRSDALVAALKDHVVPLAAE